MRSLNNTGFICLRKGAGSEPFKRDVLSANTLTVSLFICVLVVEAGVRHHARDRASPGGARRGATVHGKLTQDFYRLLRLGCADK